MGKVVLAVTMKTRVWIQMCTVICMCRFVEALYDDRALSSPSAQKYKKPFVQQFLSTIFKLKSWKLWHTHTHFWNHYLWWNLQYIQSWPQNTEYCIQRTCESPLSLWGWTGTAQVLQCLSELSMIYTQSSSPSFVRFLHGACLARLRGHDWTSFPIFDRGR